MGIAIVAIPVADDPVWKYSSEKIPHMTLLFLGDGPLRDQENAVQYIQHVAKTCLSTFGMTVKRRGPLGPNDADVLFFDKDWANKDIVSLRAHLLANESISIAQESAPQFEGWIPHLTMGFPETPAKTDDREYPGFNYVRFDRIAIWFDDYDGPEFFLESNDMMECSPSSMYMSDTEGEELEHKFNESLVKRDTGGQFSTKADNAETPVSDEEKAALLEKLGKLGYDKEAMQKVFDKDERASVVWKAINAPEVKEKNAQSDKAYSVERKQRSLGRGVTMHDDLGSDIEGEELAHTEGDTAQDVFDALSDENKDLFATIVAAAVDDVDLSTEDDIIEAYNALTEEQQAVLDFFVGVATSEVFEDPDNDDTLRQTAVGSLAADILEHSGVKGMKWGVRNDKEGGSSSSPKLRKSASNTAFERQQARSNVKSGKATLGEAHRAAIKSRGHRIFNAIFGDKTYWKRFGVITGISVASIGLAAAIVPAASLLTVGIGIVGAHNVVSDINYIDNVARGLRGNQRISNSYNKLGAEAHKLAVAGDRRTRRILKNNGSLKKKFLKDKNSTVKHSALEDLVGEILDPKELEHSGVRGMRWGYRRKVGSDGLVRGKVPKDPHEAAAHPTGSADHERAITALAKKNEKGLHSLSNQEIKDINTRLKAIVELNKALTPEHKSEIEIKLKQLQNENLFAIERAKERERNKSVGRKLAEGFLSAGKDIALKELSGDKNTTGRKLFEAYSQAKKKAAENQKKVKEDQTKSEPKLNDPKATGDQTTGQSNTNGPITVDSFFVQPHQTPTGSQLAIESGGVPSITTLRR